MDMKNNKSLFYVQFRGLIAPKLGLRPISEHTDKSETEEYLLQESQYVARKILEVYGWTDFVNFCVNGDMEDFMTKHTPCEGPDGQCGFECSRYEKCVMRRPAKLVFEK